MPSDSMYDVVVIGTGFASSFFLHKFLQENTSVNRVLVIEKGDLHTHSWQLENLRNSVVDFQTQYNQKGLSEKKWAFNIGFGGSSNCWTGCTPRMLPNDFKLKSLYGVGYDWPISYEELEPYYMMTEEIMSVSGPGDWSLSYRSGEFPHPPHNLSLPDKILKQAYPKYYYPQASARARVATENRPGCCATAICHLCPINAKFTIQNEMQHVYKDPRVELVTSAEVTHLEFSEGTVNKVYFSQGAVQKSVSGDLVVLGANGIFNPHILKRSGDDHPLLGRRLHEQMATMVQVDLDGVDNFQGSTIISGQGYMFYDGPHRSEYGACITESFNFIGALREEYGKWRQRMMINFIVEDLPLDKNFVGVGSNEKPDVTFESYSDYGLKGLQQVPGYIEELSRHLPITDVYYDEKFSQNSSPKPTEAHIQGTVVMGNDPAKSVVDKYLVHHKYRNLLVLGSSAFPTGAPVNPTLTLSAMSLMAAENLL